MTYFQTLFQELHSNVIEYNGNTYYRFFPISIAGEALIKFKFIHSDSRFTQAIVLFFSEGFDGRIDVNENSVPIRKRFPMLNFWEDTAPNEFNVRITNYWGEINICNGSDPLGNKLFCKHLSEGCAMIVQQLGDYHYQFLCHDHEFLGDCNNLIFEIQIITQ